jgi:hypothetical protein
MKRITYFNLAGRELPLNFSLRATREITARVGDLSRLGDLFSGGLTKDAVETVSFLFYTLIREGAEYMLLTEGRDVDIPSPEDFETLLGVGDFAALRDALTEAMSAGAQRAVEAGDPIKGDAGDAVPTGEAD